MARTCGIHHLFVVSTLVAFVLVPIGIAGASSPITINDYSSGPEDQPATPYPSGPIGGVADAPPIDKVTVTLTGLTHGALDNVDVLLVSAQTGQAVELMSDVGGPFPATSLDLTFDDAATLLLPQGLPATSGTYKPTNYAGTTVPCLADSPPTSGNADPFPAPAPPPPVGGYSEALASFHGNWNGGFRLYVADDCGGGAGTISNWSVDVTYIRCSEICLIKKADAVTVNAGSRIGFTLDAFNNYWWCQAFPPDDCDAYGVTLDDPLPSGTGLSWSIDPSYSGPGTCSITGAVGSQMLSCNFGVLSQGGGTTVHVSSSTNPLAGCGTYTNTGTLSSFNFGVVQDTSSTTVTGCGPTAASLVAFNAMRSKRGVLVRWRTASEAGTLGFNVYRGRAGKLRRVNAGLIPSVSATGHAYSWLDRTTRRRGGALKYRLQMVNLDGTRHWLGAAFVAR